MTTFAMPEPNPVLRLLLATSFSRPGTVELTADSLIVRLGHTWTATVPRADITSAGRDPLRTISIGAHGWRGDWLVNTTTRSLVVLTIEPEGRGRCLGYPIRLRRLHVSLSDPDGFLAELGAPAPS